MAFNSMKILVIDDVEDNLITLKALIGQYIQEVTIITALDGKTGINLAKEKNPDMILLDIFMPEIDGFEVCSTLKQIPETREIPVVFLTAAKGDSTLKVKALDVGGEAFLSKPINPSELIAQIRAMKKISLANKARHDEKERLEKLVEIRTAELRVSQMEAESAKEVQSKFLANMSHEIRTPLNGILGMIDLTLLTNLTSEQNEYLTVAKSSGNTVVTIINDILDYIKIDEGRLSINSKAIEIREFFKTIENLYLPSANKKGINFTIDIDEAIPEIIFSDEVRLVQILSNFIGNAIKFTENGFVEVTLTLLELKDEQVSIRFAVKDSGIGVPYKKRDKLFERFYQLDNSTTKNYSGTGLGLAISKNLVGLLKGTIDYSSVEGEGSSFWFDLILPFSTLDDLKRVNDLNTDKMLINEDRALKDILVVDDDLVNQKLMKALLEREGYNVKFEGNGFDGLNAYKRNKYDLVFMDISMPIMDGYESVKLMKESEESLSQCKIIAMTALALKGDKELCLERGFDDYIAKPLVFEKIYEILKHYLINDSKN